MGKLELRYFSYVGMILEVELIPKKCWNMLTFGHALNGGQSPCSNRVAEPEKQDSLQFGV
jgi:hypothetical protein